MRRTLTASLLFFLMTLNFPVLRAGNVSDSGSLTRVKKHDSVIMNPSVWVSHCYTVLNNAYLNRIGEFLDTVTLHHQIRERETEVMLLKKSYYGNEQRFSIRSVHALKMRVADLYARVLKEQRQVHHENERLAGNLHKVLEIGKQIEHFRKTEDSLVRVNFDLNVVQLESRQKKSAAFLAEQLNRSTHIETRMNELHISVYRLLSDLTQYLQFRETAMVKKELPPVWNSFPSDYPTSLKEAVLSSFQQTLETLTYYSEMSLWRIVIFRFLVFLFCLIPIRIFNDRQRKNLIISNTRLTFLDKYPKTASLVMAMALSPVIFVHPPHAFLEIILIGVTFTVTMIVIRHYPLIDKKLVLPVILVFLVLYLINFFVTPTFAGRLVFTSAILLFVPLIMIFKRIPEYQLRHPKSVRVLLLFLIFHLIAGWIFVVLGMYTLGRSIMLAGYSILILTMILRIAIFTLLDYFTIIAYFVNRNLRLIRINAEFLTGISKPLLMAVSFLFLVLAYLYNMNLLELVMKNITDFMTDERTLGTAQFTWLSILLFFLSIYLAFMLATILHHTFLLQGEATVEKRSHLGSFFMLMRLLILIAGFVIGILLSGIPMSSFALVMGAIGVGVGFGLQNIVSNLISGLIIAFERPFVVGDLLDLGADTGRVKEINLRATTVGTSEGADILIPNNTLLSQNLKNWTISSKQRFIELKLTTRHDTNPEEVISVIGLCMDELTQIVRPKSVVVLSDINESGFAFTIRLLITDLSQAWVVKSQLLTSVRSAFGEKGIAFAQRIGNQ